MSGNYRHPHTANEQRAYHAASANELGVAIRVRGRRTPRALWSAHDDYFKDARRCWKRYRKTQHRPVRAIPTAPRTHHEVDAA